MSTAAIQRQYNEVIAAHYDLDPQFVTTRALACALDQLKDTKCLSVGLPTLDLLDLGMGTGLFIEQFRRASHRETRPCGLDLSERMVEIAQGRIPDLVAAIDDAANFDAHFGDDRFDLICTHFITGFVPIEHLAPLIWERLKPGGYWSFVGGTSGAFPTLQKKSQSRLLRMMFGGKKFEPTELITPADCDAVVQCFDRHHFATSQATTFEPELHFSDFEEFMEFAYRGGWLTPFIEELGLQHASPSLQAMLNALVFPMCDHHRIVIALAQRPIDEL
jgi:hypothetical protein